MRVALSDGDIRQFIDGPYAGIVRTVALICESPAGAEDAVHEALARAWVRRSTIEHLDRWVLTVALNLARSRWRRLGRESSVGEVVPACSDDDLPDLDLRAAIRDLSPRQREVVVLHYFLDQPVAEIAAVTGLSEGGVKHALFRARRSLANRLSSAESEELRP